MNLSMELDLSIPGIKMKSASKTTIIDKDTDEAEGVAKEVDLGELKDERVNFLYDADVDFILDGNPQFRYKGREVIDLEDPDTGEELIQYPPTGDAILPIKTIDFAGVVQTGSSLSTLVLPPEASSTNDIYNGEKIEIKFINGFIEKKTVSDYVGATKILTLNTPLSSPPVPNQTTFEILSGDSIHIRPANEYLKESDPENSTSVLIDRIWLAACGFWSNGNYNLSKFVSPTNNSIIVKDNKDVPWISVKNFKRRIQELREFLIPKGIEIQSTIFSKTIDENGDDINDSGLSRKNTRSYAATKVAAEEFIINRSPLLDPIVDPTDPETFELISPFDVSIQTVQKSIQLEEDELYSELLESLDEVIDKYDSFKNEVSILEGNIVDATNTITGDVTTLVIIDFPVIINVGYPPGSFPGITNLSTRSAIKFPNTASNVSGEYVGFFVNIIGGTPTLAIGQSKKIIAYDGGQKIAILESEWSVLPVASTSVFRITPPSTSVNILDNAVDLNTNIQDDINFEIATTIKTARTLASSIKYSQIENKGTLLYAQINSSFNELKQAMKRLDDIIKQVLWFEFFQGISLKNSKISCARLDVDGVSRFTVPEKQNYRKLARILVPVDMGIKVQKVKKKNLLGLGFLGRYKYTRTDLGIRFAEVRFIDTSVLTKFRKNESTILESILQSASPTTATFGSDADNSDASFSYIGFSIEITDGTGVGQIRKITNYVKTTRVATIDSPWDTGAIPNSSSKYAILKSYEPTNPDPIPSEINVTYEIPHLPYDTELRKSAFDQFGLFDNTTNSSHENIQDTNGNPLVDFETMQYFPDPNTPLPFYSGYEIFKNTSKSITDMRAGMDIYKKIQFLLVILRDTFGSNRVKLIETVRSFEDQNKIQFGGESSNFMSWHNYGLSAKIIITDESEITQIKDGSDDFFKLLNIAEIFTNACFNGEYGEPLNIVWCGRLKTGPDLFVWEFLPIGVDHKDILKFRDSIYNQIDPVLSNGLVDATNFIVPPNVTLSSPYIKANSSALSNAIKIKDKKFVPTDSIVNYDIPKDLVLKDIQEFLFLIRNKLTANGNTLAQNKDIIEWKLNNPISFRQLMLYHSILGSYNLVRNFLGIDYIDRFESIIIAAYQNDPEEFVKSYLGETSYNNIQINVRVSSDSGYISLASSYVDSEGNTISIEPGSLFVKRMDVVSKHPEGNGNTFGQKQISPKNAEIVELGFIVSDAPVITPKQIKLIHIMIRDQILSEYKLIKDSFLNLQTDFLHDSVFTGSNAELSDLMENEFGVIKTQDLIPFDQMKQLFNRRKVNTSGDNTPNLDGTLRGLGVDLEGKESLEEEAGKESIYESLISTLSDTGIQFVKPGKEKVIVEELQEKPMEIFIKLVTKKKQPDITDLL